MCGQSQSTVLANYIAQKFGYQREDYGNTAAQKSLNTFDKAVYYPTNWRGNWENFRGKLPVFLHFGATVKTPPEYYQKNYLGITPLNLHPLIEPPQPYANKRLS